MLSNFEALRLVAHQVPRVRDPIQGRAIALAALFAFVSDTPAERDAALGAARQLLTAALAPDDQSAA